MSRAGPGMFFIDATVDARRLDEVVLTMMEELAQLRTGRAAGLAESFVRARRMALYQTLAQASGAEATGRLVASLARAGGGAPVSEVDLARQIMETTLTDLAPLLAEELAPKRQVIGLLGPPASIAAARRAAGL